MRGFAWAALSIGAGAAGSLLNERLLVEPASQQPQSARSPATEAGGRPPVGRDTEQTPVGAGAG